MASTQIRGHWRLFVLVSFLYFSLFLATCARLSWPHSAFESMLRRKTLLLYRIVSYRRLRTSESNAAALLYSWTAGQIYKFVTSNFSFRLYLVASEVGHTSLDQWTWTMYWRGWNRLECGTGVFGHDTRLPIITRRPTMYLVRGHADYIYRLNASMTYRPYIHVLWDDLYTGRRRVEPGAGLVIASPVTCSRRFVAYSMLTIVFFQ